MKIKKIACVGFIWALLFITAGFLACAHVQVPTGQPAKPAVEKEKRSITIIQKMRTQAVSRRVGRWAVVVGISDYKYDIRRDPARGIPDLKYANRDARAFAKFLMSPGGGAFSPERVLLLTDHKATVKEVRKAIGDFLAQSLEEDLVILFYAGHGAPDPKNPENLYLLCHDTEPGNYYGTALPMWEIDIALSRTIRSRRVFVFADACHSAGVGGTRAVSVSDRLNKYMKQLAGSKMGVTKITASRSDELSQEREFPEGGHGVFTYYLIKGLQGEADDNRDGFVTTKEAFDYLYDKVRSETRHSQNPWASAYVSPDIPLGIVDSQVLAAIRSRAEAMKERPSLSEKPYRPSPPAIEIPKDSSIAVKLARAKLVKDDTEMAKDMLEAIVARNDTSKPDALALKIQIFLHEGDLKGAEDTEDLLVIPYPKHPAAEKGARLVYEYYLKETEGAGPAEQIRLIESYLKRHPGGLSEQEAKDKLDAICGNIRTRYEKGFQESLILAEGFIRQSRFDRAQKELNMAVETAREVLTTFGITLDTKRVADLRLLAETQEQKYRWEQVYREAKDKAERQTPEEKIKTLNEFMRKNPGNPYTEDAEKELAALRNRAQAQLQTRYDQLLSEAKTSLGRKNFSRALEKLDAATVLFRKAGDELGISLKEADIYQVRERHRTEAEKHRDYLAWNRADSEARAVRLEDKANYDRRIFMYEDFQKNWPGNPYRSNAQQAVSELKQQKITFMDRKFREYFGKAKEYFIANNYTGAYQSLENARNYATSGQIREIDELARRYNAPPEVSIVLDRTTIDWETPVLLKYRAKDREGDSVRVQNWDFGDGASSREDNPRHAYAKWGGSQKERQYVVTLKATDGHTTVMTKKTLTVKKQDCIARDGSFCKYANGIVLDTKTGLMWAAKDNWREINWYDAKKYCENYRGGGYWDWRMPTQDELASLYDPNKENRHGYPITKLIDTSGCCPWASETRGSMAAYFHFSSGSRNWDYQSGSSGGRALPVRGGN